MIPYLVFQEEHLMLYSWLALRKDKRQKLQQKWRTSGKLPLTPSFIKIGLVVLLEVSSLKVVFTTVPLLKTF